MDNSNLALECQLDFNKKALAQEIKGLISRLERELKKLEADEIPSSLGIIQVQGSSIDTRCAVIATLHSCLENYNLHNA